MTSTTIFFLFIPFLAVILLAVNLIFAPHNPYQEKNSVFECGYHSFLGQNRTQFSVSFFIFALLFLLFDLEILLIYPYIVSSYTITIYGLVIMIIFFLVLTLGFQYELGKKALTIYSRQFNIIKYIYTFRLSKQANLLYTLNLLNINLLLKYIFNKIINKIYMVLISKVKSYLISIVEEIFLDIYNKWFKVYIDKFIKAALNITSILYSYEIVPTLTYLWLLIDLTYLFSTNMPELCNMYIIYNLYYIYISSILLVVFISLFIYINSMDNNFENNHPFLHFLLNIFCTILIIGCLFCILLSVYSIFEETF